MKKLVLILLLLVMVLPMGVVFGQEEAPYSLNLRRDFGYGNGADIQGRMTISVKGEESQVAKVIFTIDDQEMAQVSTVPFKYSFNTDQYPAAVHQLSAKVETLDGKSFQTRSLTYRFVTGSDVTKGMTRILVPIGIIALLGMVVPALLQSSAQKKRQQHPGEPVNYGYSGGAICPKCGYPFARSFLSPHIGGLKFERCPSCKKWSMVGRASMAELREAELAQARKYGTEFGATEAEQTVKEEKNQLDDTRYTDGL